MWFCLVLAINQLKSMLSQMCCQPIKTEHTLSTALQKWREIQEAPEES